MLRKIDNGLRTCESWFLVVGIAVMGVIMAMEVVLRLVGKPLSWSEELAKYIFVWVVFIGMCYGIGKGLHIRLELFEDKFPPKMLKIVSILCDVICIAVFLYLLKPSAEYFVSQCTQKMASIPLHMGYVVIVMPITFVLSTFRMILDIIYQIQGGK